MNFLENIFQQTEKPSKSYADFWNWFQKKEGSFFKVIKAHGNIEEVFFNAISPKLDEIKEGIFYLTGMADEDTVELVLTPDGNVENVVFVEELVSAAPKIKGWKFTALKPALAIENVSISMSGYDYNSENLFFYALEDKNYPDDIDLIIIHKDYNEADARTITSGTFIFLDNFLGELNSITAIDEITVIGETAAEKELIPIAKLKAYLNWRQKEFLEKYEGVRYQIEEDNHSVLTKELKGGEKLIAVLNTDLLKWGNKASHPWIMIVEIKFEGGVNGMASDETLVVLEGIENELLESLKDFEGYLNIGRETKSNLHRIYFACRDFRKPSKVLYLTQQKYIEGFEFNFEIYKDKYWRIFNRYGIL